jgi:predicted outer membrane protein
MRDSAAVIAATMFVLLSGAATAEPAEPVPLATVDYAFIAQTNLGNHFQIDSGKLGETHARSAAVRDYATLMDGSHVQVENNLMSLLRKMHLEPAPASLLSGGYKGVEALLAAESGTAGVR